MSDTIGPDGLTDGERADVDALGLDERDHIRSAARKCACRAPGESVTLTDAELRAMLGWVERGAAEDTAQQFGTRRFAAIIAERDAERLAHAQTRAERDRLRAVFERMVDVGVATYCNTRKCGGCTVCSARALLGEVKP